MIDRSLNGRRIVGFAVAQGSKGPDIRPGIIPEGVLCDRTRNATTDLAGDQKASGKIESVFEHGALLSEHWKDSEKTHPIQQRCRHLYIFNNDLTQN
jgi:hypothetical protein